MSPPKWQLFLVPLKPGHSLAPLEAKDLFVRELWLAPSLWAAALPQCRWAQQLGISKLGVDQCFQCFHVRLQQRDTSHQQKGYWETTVVVKTPCASRCFQQPIFTTKTCICLLLYAYAFRLFLCLHLVFLGFFFLFCFCLVYPAETSESSAVFSFSGCSSLSILLLALLTSSTLQKKCFTWALSNIPKKISSRPGCAAPPHRCCKSCSQFPLQVKEGWPGSWPEQRPCPWFSAWNWVQWLWSAPLWCHRHRQLRLHQLPTCDSPWCRRK